METLDYASDHLLKRRKLRRVLITILTMTVVIGGTTGFFFSSGREWISERYQLWRLRKACDAFVEPPGKVVYEEDPAEATRLLATKNYRTVPYAGTLAGTDWNPVVRILPKPLDTFKFASAIVLLGERKLPNGDSRTVMVSLQNQNQEELGQGRVLTFTAMLFDLSVNQAIATVPTKSLEIPGLAPGDRVRVLAGQPDSNNPSAFCIDFQINDKKQALRGWIADNTGNIELKLR